jgi:pimeloyl-ACP methyl ester carboxylesterase
VSLDFDHLEASVRGALALPVLQADAARCSARIDLVVTDAAPAQSSPAYPISLWAGAPGGPAITLSAGAGVWAEVFAAVPPVGRQSVGALRRQCPGFVLEGAELAVAQALPFIERLLEGVRSHLNALPGGPPLDRSGLEFIEGSYLRLDGPGADWVYTERAGLERGPPLLMLHTAGADARQWHGLMGQRALRDGWSLHAFDLPGHGRSPLPANVAGDWRLTEALYLQWVIGYLDAAGLDRVALMGCSMGSAIGLALLAKRPQRIAGAVLLEAPYHSPGRRSKYLNHPEVHGGRLGAAWVGSLLSPTSPRAGRDEATWIYSQAAPGIYDGDLAYYSDDFNAHAHTARIDTARTPLWLMTGNYDYSATPDDSRRVAAEVPGARFVELQGFGHFPMVENAGGLMPYLGEPLADIKARFAAGDATRTPEAR